MKTEAPALQQSRGFTLVEILVVVLIIGLGVGIVSFTIGGNQPLALRNEARQFATQLEMVAGEAVLAGEAWGLQFYRSVDRDTGDNQIGWRWLRYRDVDAVINAEMNAQQARADADEKNNDEKREGKKTGWQPEAPRDLKAFGSFSANIEAVLEIEGKEVAIELLADDSSGKGQRDGKKTARKTDEKSGPQPDVWLAPGGEMTPFALQLRFIGDSDGPIVRGDSLGRIELDTHDEVL